MCYDPDYRRKTRTIAWQKAEKIIKRLNDNCKIAVLQHDKHVFSSEFNFQIDITGTCAGSAIAGVYWSIKSGRVCYYFGERNKKGKPVIHVCEESELKYSIFDFLTAYDFIRKE